VQIATGSTQTDSTDFWTRLKPILFAVACCFAFNAQANPIGGNVVNGQASFNTSGNTLTVTNTPGTIINWQGFSIGANETTHFAQQSASSTVLNHVVTNNPSVILGTLSSNGQVYLVNANGIIFGAGSTVDVAGLVATTLNLSNADFLAGRHNYTAAPGAQNISNSGNITAQQGGQIYLIAPNVENNGIIKAPNGEVLLAAGNSVELVNSNDPNLRVKITAPAGDATNIGQLVVGSGNLGLFGTVVKNSGTVNADSAVMQGGKIVFRASHSVEAGGTISANGTSGGSVNIMAEHSADSGTPGVVIHTGNIQAQGTAGAGGKVRLSGDSILSSAAITTNGVSSGGQISVLASNQAISTSSAQYSVGSLQGAGGDILVLGGVSNYSSGSYSARGMTGGNLVFAGDEIKLAGAYFDASGYVGGGNINIGGLMHGAQGFSAQGIALANATSVATNASTRLVANAIMIGTGGQVVLWSDQSMRYSGFISAKGGTFGGNGGNAEVSGLTSLGYSGLVNLSARKGVNGTLLLDPRNINIVAGNSSGVTNGSTFKEFLDPTPGAGEGFGGWQNLELTNGNILISSSYDNTFGARSGAVYLYNPSGTLISAVVGSAAGDRVGAFTIYDSPGVTVLGNGNVIITSDNWSGGMGAVTWMSSSGLLSTGSAGGTVSSSNSLVGSNAGDKVGSIGNVNGLTQLVNGNVVITSSYWNNGGTPANALGAVTWMNGTNGKLSDGTNGGAVSATNSLVGSTAGDRIGYGLYGGDGITQVQVSGNYVVLSSYWGSAGVAANALGAVTWMNGTNGKLSDGTNGGVLSNANSLVGSNVGDKVGTMSITQVNTGVPYTYDSSAITVGASGNLVIVSNNWNNGGAAVGAGAVTWMNGGNGSLVGGGMGGLVSSTNSLVGTAAGDKVGTVNTQPYTWLTQETSGVLWLPNGNYLVRSGEWGSGGVTNTGRGAVTWGSGFAGVAGNISSSNSIVGSTNFDLVGAGWTNATTADPGVVVLPNGNYVVISSQWASGTGAVTWGDGTIGTSGVVSGIQTAGAAFSLVGSAPGSNVGSQGITVQTGGSNFVVQSPLFDYFTLTNNGAVTWMNGATGALSNGTFGGMVNGTNSLMGTSVSDGVGAVTALSNGNFVALTPLWNGGGVATAALGAVTWINGSDGHLSDNNSGGSISSTNSLVGNAAGDNIGSSGFTVVSNGSTFTNLLVNSYNYGSGGVSNAGLGAVTWMNGANGQLSTGGTGGVVSSANSLVGSLAGDQAGNGNGSVQLGNGNVLIHSYYWNSTAGALTWMNGASGALSDTLTGGAIGASNSLIGSTTGDQVGGSVFQLGNGNVAITSPAWDNTAIPAVDAGAVTWMNGANGHLSNNSTGGTITSANSLVGVATTDMVGNAGVEVLTDNVNFWNYAVRSTNWDNGAAAAVDAGAVTWVNGTTGMTSDGSGFISTANSLVGSNTNDRVGFGLPLVLGNGNLVLSSYHWNNDAGAVTWMQGQNGKLADNSNGGIVSAVNSLVGSNAGDQIGFGAVDVEITNGSTFWNYVVVSQYWNSSAGAVTLGNGASGTVGVVSASNSLVGGAANDAVGSGGIVLVSNGTTFWNYVVSSFNWGTTASLNGGLGAVTWVNGQTGQLTTGTIGGVVSSSNSLVGSTANDLVGAAGGTSGGVNVFGNGNLLIRSQFWSGQFSAMTWMNGATGKLVDGANGGVVSASNSVLGSTIYDNLGSGALAQLGVNGNWLITSWGWNNSMGAVTWMNGTNGLLADGSSGGVLSATNSLVGSVAGDEVGGYLLCDCSTPGGINTLSNGNYVVFSPFWSSSTGAATWGNGSTGLVGVVSASNSVLGVTSYYNALASQPDKVLVGTGTANGGAGGVYLLGSITLASGGSLFSENPATDAFIGAGWITSTLNLGTNVTLQANNDITQAAGAGITATGTGNLMLQAGRSVVLNDVIDINGTLGISANDAGADPANRAPGAAVIDTSSATLSAASIKFTNSGGNIITGSLTAKTGAIDLIASSLVRVTAGMTSVGNITVAGNSFENATPGNPFNTSGRWLVYTRDPSVNTLGSLTADFELFGCSYTGGCVGHTLPAIGNGLLYSSGGEAIITRPVLYALVDSTQIFDVQSRDAKPGGGRRNHEGKLSSSRNAAATGTPKMVCQ
jgi:filamentous hemagglutinin family protein